MTQLLHVVCPHCDTVNRVPVTRLEDAATCGRCHKPLFAGSPIEVGAQRFPIHLKRSDLPIVVDFWAPWCAPCLSMAPAFAAAAVELEPRCRLVKVNTEAETQLAATYGIRSIPTLVMFLRGQEVARQAGAMSKSDIIRWVERIQQTD